MITIDNLKGLTTTSFSLKGRDKFTFKLGPDLAIDSIIEVLAGYFSKSEKRRVIKLNFDDVDFCYLARKDFMSSMPISARGIGTSDGGTLPAGYPSSLKIIELCCSVKGCKKIYLVTNSDPSYCDDHKTLLKPCHETR